MTLNRDKCGFGLTKLKFFFYHKLSSDGVGPSEEKIVAIVDTRPPDYASEVQSFMWLVQYSGKVMPGVASIAKPIEDLTRKGVPLKWVAEKQEHVLSISV